MSGRRLAVPDNLIDPIYKGYVNKQGGSHKNWKTRYTILYPHLMVYYENSTKFDFDVKRCSLENRKNHIALQGGHIAICRSSDDKLKFAFTITARSSDNKRSIYVIANSNESDRALWMEKVTEAINGEPKPIHPKSKLLTKQSTLRLLDQDTAESVRCAMENKGGESDIDDTDSETEQDPVRRSTKSHHLGSVSKSKSTNLPEPKLTAQATIGADNLVPNKAPKLLSKDSQMMTVDAGTGGGMGSLDDGAKVRDDLGLNSGAKSSLSDTDHLSATCSASRSTEEVLVTWPLPDASPIPKQMVLGKEGFLNKQGGKHKTWKHRYVVAVPGRLAYYKSKPNSPGDKAMGVVKLKNVVLSSKPAIPKYGNLFELNSNSQWNKRGTYVFSASTPADKAEWLESLEILGGDCKAQIEELRGIESNRQDPIGAEKRARSFIHEVSQSIEIDDDVTCPKPPSIEVQDEETIPGIKPPTTKTKRHREGEFDLDISFITDRILVMSFPYSTQELSTFQVKGRNQIDTVERFLSGKYNKSYRIYNLCKEMKYPDSRFNGNIGLYPFEDHCSPTLSLIQAFLKDMQQWMGASGSNVSVVHCSSGKGRSGCMIASYLIYAMGMFFNEAIELFNTHRINFGSGLSLPSHLRYIKYIDRIRLKPELSFDREHEKVVEFIQVHTPNLCDSEWKPFITIVSVDSGTEIFNSMKDGETAQNLKTKVITIRNINLPVRKDVQINIWNFEENVLNELSLVAYLFFNVSFVGNSLQFSKQELDKLFKSKMRGFSISIQFKEGN